MAVKSHLQQKLSYGSAHLATEGKTMAKQYSVLDRLCISFDHMIRALSNNSLHSGKPYPAEHVAEKELSPSQKKQAAGLMRVNHAGEICAQALYHGQALVSRHMATNEHFNRAAVEEGDHLKWCQTRLEELGSHPSYLNPLWYGGSLCIGMIAGMIGDPWSLGFVVETERQVIAHLEKHRRLLPAQDERSTAILQQMERDEAKHRDEAVTFGAKELPGPVKTMMSLVSKVMVKTSYWV